MHIGLAQRYRFVNGSTITGGNQGVAVMAGVHFEASNLTVTIIRVTGVEVKDKGPHSDSPAASCTNLGPPRASVIPVGCRCTLEAQQTCPPSP